MRKIFYSLAIVFGILIIGFSFTEVPYGYAACIFDPNFPTKPCNDTPNLTFGCGVNEIPLYLEHSFDLKRSTMPSGKMSADVSNICLNEEKQILEISLFSAYFTIGQMTINIPRENLNPLTPSCEDDVFQIEKSGKFTPYEETKTIDFREITFPIMSNDYRIVIFAENPENTKLCNEKSIDNEITKKEIKSLSPLKQINNEILPIEVECKVGLELIFKSSGAPACVKPKTAEKLIERGWVPQQHNTEFTDNVDSNKITETIQGHMDKNEVFTKLTANLWCNKSEDSPFMGYSEYQFKANGEYKIYGFNDYSSSTSTGKWSLEKSFDEDWILLYDNGLRTRITLNYDGTLTMGPNNAKINPCEPLIVSDPYTAETLPEVQLPDEVIQRIDQIIAQKWKRTNDFDLNFKPTSIEFKKNHEYVTTYRYGECQNHGDWYTGGSGIRGSSLSDKCDSRGSDNPETIYLDFLGNGHLFRHTDLYVPEDYPLDKGIIWKVGGYSHVVEIKVKYDMPIKKGIPNQFDIEMTNVGQSKSHESLELDRFFITEKFDYNNYIKDSEGKTIHLSDEIAAIDLNSKILKRGETHIFSLNVTFPESGEQSMRINSLIIGPTQNWDFHQHYSINVQ